MAISINIFDMYGPSCVSFPALEVFKKRRKKKWNLTGNQNWILFSSSQRNYLSDFSIPRLPFPAPSKKQVLTFINFHSFHFRDIRMRKKKRPRINLIIHGYLITHGEMVYEFRKTWLHFVGIFFFFAKQVYKVSCTANDYHLHMHNHALGIYCSKPRNSFFNLNYLSNNA